MFYGRRIYETMAAYWPTAADDPNATPVVREYGEAWNATPRIVFSRTLAPDAVRWNSRLAQGSIEEELARLNPSVEGEVEVCGPTLAWSFIERDLIDEYRVVVHPVILGAGTPYLPPLERQLALRLVESHRFSSGAIYLGYART
jgi:dihydrofolate reductase